MAARRACTRTLYGRQIVPNGMAGASGPAGEKSVSNGRTRAHPRSQSEEGRAGQCRRSPPSIMSPGTPPNVPWSPPRPGGCRSRRRRPCWALMRPGPQRALAAEDCGLAPVGPVAHLVRRRRPDPPGAAARAGPGRSGGSVKGWLAEQSPTFDPSAPYARGSVRTKECPSRRVATALARTWCSRTSVRRPVARQE